MSRQLELYFAAGLPHRAERLQRAINSFQAWTEELARRLEVDMKFFWIQTASLLPELGDGRDELARDMLETLHLDSHSLWDALPRCNQALLRAVPVDGAAAPARIPPARVQRKKNIGRCV